MNFFRRFYLWQSIYEFDPIEMSYSAILLAIKVEELSINIDRDFFGKIDKPLCNKKTVFNNEIILIKGLKF